MKKELKNVKPVKKSRKKPQIDIDENKERNRETNLISFVFIGIFLGMVAYLSWFSAFKGQEVINNPYNSRIDNLASTVIRGDITAADGTILAENTSETGTSETREYPFGRVFSHVVGLSTHGKSGLEKLCNFYLLKPDPDLVGQLYNDMTNKKDKGSTVTTTLDVNLQQAAYEALGNNKGAVVVMEPSTGKILAMVSKPDYDPGSADELWNEWISYDSADSVLLNRATQGLYPPGSTFKILTALEYIRENPGYQAFSYNCNGEINVTGGGKIHCFNSTVHGNEDLNKAFANSCNSAFAYIGMTLNKLNFRNLCESFYFNKDLPLGVEYSRSSFSLNDASGISEVMETSIGQGQTMISPIHNLLIASAVANDGVIMTPYLVQKITASGGAVIKEFEPRTETTVMSREESDLLTQYMRSVVTSGTGNALKSASYQAAGKTGSAQYDNSENYHSWFVGFAPADAPQISISVILEGGYSGVANAQSVARKVMDAYFVK